MLFSFSKPSFEIFEDESVVELKACGELTANNASMFRSNLLKLLQHGKSKSYKLNLAGVSAMDDSIIQLICTLNDQLTITKTQLTIELPYESGLRAISTKRILKMLS